MEPDFEMKKRLWEMGRKAGDEHFLLFPHMFSKEILLKVLKSQECIVKS